MDMDEDAAADDRDPASGIVWGDWQLHASGTYVFRLGFRNGTVVASESVPWEALNDQLPELEFGT